MTEALQVTDETAAPALPTQTPAGLALMNVGELLSRRGVVTDVMSKVMKEGQHYGRIPGVDKPTLLQPGAELLGSVFRLVPNYDAERAREGEHLTVTVTCRLTHADGTYVGEGLGVASTLESKHRWRNAKRKCPECGEDLRKSKKDDGFYCWEKTGGCGANFHGNDDRVTGQVLGKIENPDPADLYNTVVKMACKRAFVMAIKTACAASDIFTQDVEDMDLGSDRAPKGSGQPEPARNSHARSSQAPLHQPGESPWFRDFERMREEHGLSVDVVRRYIEGEWGNVHPESLRPAEKDQLVDWVKAGGTELPGENAA